MTLRLCERPGGGHWQTACRGTAGTFWMGRKRLTRRGCDHDDPPWLRTRDMQPLTNKSIRNNTEFELNSLRWKTACVIVLGERQDCSTSATPGTSPFDTSKCVYRDMICATTALPWRLPQLLRLPASVPRPPTAHIQNRCCVDLAPWATSFA